MITLGFIRGLGQLLDSSTRFDDNMRFTGHERDFQGNDNDADDLDYMHARYYATHLCRFITTDPSRRSADPKVPQSWNRYTYVASNPLKFVDPDGRRLMLAADQAKNFSETLERNSKIRSSIRARLESIPIVGPSAAFVADALISDSLPATVEEANSSLPGAINPLGAVGSIGTNLLSRIGKKLFGLNPRNARIVRDVSADSRGSTLTELAAEPKRGRCSSLSLAESHRATSTVRNWRVESKSSFARKGTRPRSTLRI